MSMAYIQFQKLDDLIRFVNLSHSPFIQYLKLNGHNVYFIQLLGLGVRILYYAELDKEVEEKYVVYNRFRDIITFSNKIESDGQSVSIPILKVIKTNVFSEYPPK